MIEPHLSTRLLWHADQITKLIGTLTIIVDFVQSDGNAKGKITNVQVPVRTTVSVSGLSSSEVTNSVGWFWESGETLKTEVSFQPSDTGLSLSLPVSVSSPKKGDLKRKVCVDLNFAVDSVTETPIFETSPLSAFTCVPNASETALARWWKTGATFAIVLAISACRGYSPPSTTLFEKIPDAVKTLGALAEIGYLLLILTLVAAILERVNEVVISARRRSGREIREAIVEGLRKRSKFSKDVRLQNDLVIADIDLLSYRAETRTWALRFGVVVGALVGALGSIGLVEALNLPISKDHKELTAALDVVIVSALVSGGTQPIHDVVAAIQKAAKSIKSWTKP
ncbi:hypothetical protein [Pelagibius sp. Alg239-R121]|uniref:hypothetical protein n=1 Tax=Pelagibius sp. Alg239-R121 TaxID=2993448 RepID=UPI0024A72932|nr:hypothetical protein [Pelagibius sp. Alg239-R121]